jgi:hypothetical protein
MLTESEWLKKLSNLKTMQEFTFRDTTKNIRTKTLEFEKEEPMQFNLKNDALFSAALRERDRRMLAPVDDDDRYREDDTGDYDGDTECL